MKTLRFFLTAVLTVFAGYCLQAQTPTLKDDLNKAENLLKQGNQAEATKVYLEIMGKYPENREAVQGWLMINMKRIPTGEEEAIGQLEELEKTYPGNTGILFFKTFLQVENNHLDAAIKNAEKLTTLQPNDGLNWLLKGQTLEALGRIDEALPAYEKATSLSPDNADAWQNRAGLLAKTKKYDEAISLYTRAIDLAPGQPVLVYNRGCAYCLKGDKGNALADLGKAIAMNPQFRTYAPKDEDFKSLWEDEDFKKITSQQ
jgi:tetratricopeptide (TPR) repeat protein